jgi:hypothetical protein
MKQQEMITMENGGVSRINYVHFGAILKFTLLTIHLLTVQHFSKEGTVE